MKYKLSSQFLSPIESQPTMVLLSFDILSVCFVGLFTLVKDELNTLNFVF
jgi:hypothetical protein